MRPALGWAGAAAAALALPLLTSNTYYLYLGTSVAILVVVATGLNVLTGLSGQVSLGHAGLYAIGAYAAALLATRAGLGLWSALPLAAALTAAVGALLALAALRLSGPYLAMVTIAFGIIVEGALVEWVAVTGGPGGVFNIPRPALAGVPLGLSRYYVVVVLAAALALWLTRNIMRSAWGRAFIAVRDSELAAESLGLSTYWLRTVAFTLSATFAGAGGTLFAFLNGYLSPDSFTLQTSILFLLVLLFGGLGLLAGPVVGAIVLVLLPEVLHQFADYRLILYGSLLLASVYFLPRGVVGALRRSPHAREAARPTTESAPPAPQPARPEARPLAVSVAPAGAMLALEGVTRAFGGVVAVADVSLAVRRGTIHSLIGPNGAGKTTLVNLVSGFYRPDRGSITLDGAAITGLAPAVVARRGLVRTFQTPQIFEELSVLDNVVVGAAGHRLGWLAGALTGLPGAGARHRRAAMAALVRARLADWAPAPAGSLPFGLRRRLEIARALAAGAIVLMLDEPAAGLAPAEIAELDALLVALRADGMTVLLVEHHMELVMEISDRVSVLDEGRLIAEGAPADIQRHPAVVTAYLGAG